MLGFLLAAAMVAPANAAPVSGAPANSVASYWTADRIANARTREFVFNPGSTRGTLVSAAPDASARSQTGKPIKPSPTPTPTPSPGTVTATTGSSWNGGGLALSATGKVFFQMGSTNYVCSGAVVTDSRTNVSLVLTAGHCVYDQASRTFATNWMFIPAYDLTPNITSCAQAIYGCWTAQALVVHTGFSSESGFNSNATRHDWAFAVVGAGTKDGRQLDVAVGSFPLLITGLAVGSFTVAFGYPAATPYSGQDLVYCAGSAGTDANNGGATWSLPCKMTGGSSGGPWMSQFAGDRGSLSSLNSYRYSNLANMYGPKFNDKTLATYQSANSATSNLIVAP
jgi:V8-like Glu-specific endopeptidase